MSFLAPIAFSLFALGGVVVFFYILKVRRRRVEVPYLRLWESLVLESRSRSLFKKLQRLLSLLLQLAILTCLILAIADPTFVSDREEIEEVILVLDTSASMGATEDAESTRFDAMLERARALIRDRSAEDSMMLLAISDRVRVASPLEKSRIKLYGALESIELTQRTLDVDRTVEFLTEVMAELPRPRVLVLGDGGVSEIPQRLAEHAKRRATESAGDDATAAANESESSAPLAQWIPIGTTRPNLAITRFSARRNESLATDFVIAEVRNLSEEPARANLEFLLDGRRQKVVPVELEPLGVRLERPQLSLPEGGTLELRLIAESDGESEELPTNALAADDRAFAIIPPHQPRRVLLVTETEAAAEPFRIAFTSMESVIDPSSTAFTLAEYESVSEADREADITICLGVLPESLDPNTHRILINTPLPEGLPVDEKGTIARPRVWDWNREHLLNRFLNYRDLPLPPARQLELRGTTPEAAESIVDGYEGPLIAAFREGRRRTIVVPFDMTAELFPFRLAFPLLLRNAISWFETSEDRVLELDYATGAVISPLRRVTAEVVSATYFVGDFAENAELPTIDGRFHFDSTDEPGPVLFRWGDEAHATAVNLFDAAESDLTVPEPPAGDNAALLGPQSRFTSEPWLLLAMIALALWALEWGLFHRRITE